MEKIDRVIGKVVPLDRANVDTDAIMPKQFLKSIKKTGFADNLFDEWRYLDHGEPGQDCSSRPLNTEFSLNQSRYQGATILLTQENFGCGSSREHAPWGLREYGFKVILAPSFADIFYQNCTRNGLLPVTLDQDIINELFKDVANYPNYQLDVRLKEQTVTTPKGMVFAFKIEAGPKKRLLEGLDDIAHTLVHKEAILAFEQQRKDSAPWLFKGENDV